MSVRTLWRTLLFLAVPVILNLATTSVTAQMTVGTIVKVGAGSYQVANVGPGTQPSVTTNVKGPIPTSDWCSSLFWQQFSSNMYAHPLVLAAGATGLHVAYAGMNVSGAGAIMSSPGQSGIDIGISGAGTFTSAPVDSYSDWFITALFASGAKSMKLSFGHGSPFVYGLYDGGDPTITFGAAPTVWSGDEKSAILGVNVGGANYALFGPTGATWSGIGTTTFTCNSGGKPYFSLALLPDSKPETLALFTKYAYSHVTDTKVAWNYDEQTSVVTSTYTFTTKQYEGTQTGTITALLPHQWTRSDAKLLGYSYNSVRGTLKLTACDSFTTKVAFPGILPIMPDNGTYDKDILKGYVRDEVGKLPTAPLLDTYWEGKNFGRVSTVAAIADTVGDPASAKACIDNVKSRMAEYFNPFNADGSVKVGRWDNQPGIFRYNPTWGTLIGYPASYGSDNMINDHHFHYGYFIRAAAEVARQDPAWAKDDQYGGMIKLLIRDIACPDRDDPMFPFLRNYDIYEGHSWANGAANNGDGNDQESSSEAMSAWTGVILWGAMTGDKKIRDTGIFLYTGEMEGIDNYWFDVRHQNFPKQYTRPMASMIWGMKTTWDTYFSGLPEWKHAINYMPYTGGSLYLGDYPAYVKINYDSLVAEKGSANFGDITDLIAMYQALYDAPAAVKATNFDTAGVENGDTRANFYYWVHNLNAMGQVDISVTADTPLYAVFLKGTTRSYVAYNATDAPLTVTFSDGKVVKIGKKGFGVESATVDVPVPPAPVIPTTPTTPTTPSTPTTPTTPTTTVTPTVPVPPLAAGSAPVLLTPADGAINLTAPVMLTWQGVTDVNGYRIQTCRDATFATGMVMLDITVWGATSLSLMPNQGAIPGTKVYWRIAPQTDPTTTGAWSPVRSFTVAAG